MIVVDTNVMTHLLMGGEGSADAALLFEQDPEWTAPVILMSELRDVLLGFVRQGALVSDQAKAMSDDAAEILGDRIATVAGDQVFDVALECGLTAYDAEFVVMARTAGSPPGHVGRRNSAGRRGRGGVVKERSWVRHKGRNLRDFQDFEYPDRARGI